MGDAWHVCSIAGCGNPGHLDGKRRICKVVYPSTVNPRLLLSPPPSPSNFSVSRSPLPLHVEKQPLGQRY
jgi:hypothetical protein